MKQALLAVLLAAPGYAQPGGPCRQVPVVTLAVRPLVPAPALPAGKDFTVTLTGTVSQPAGCSLIGATFMESSEVGPGTSGPLPLNGTTFNEIVTVSLPPLTGPVSLNFIVTVLNQVGSGRSPVVEVFVP